MNGDARAVMHAFGGPERDREKDLAALAFKLGVATVTALKPRGLAIIQTVDGAIYEVFASPNWRVGDPATCEYNERTRVPWHKLDCRKDA